tara:strand:- start:900 stop:1631 length:732 start_codon:yes stop_codon:yes gene_type:complete
MQHPLASSYEKDFVSRLTPVQEMYRESDFEIHPETLYKVSIWYKGTRVFIGSHKQAKVFNELVRDFWSSPSMMLMRNYVQRENQNWMLAIILSSARDVNIYFECISSQEKSLFETDSPYFLSQLYRICVNIGNQHLKSVVKCEDEPMIKKRTQPVVHTPNLPLETMVNWANVNTKLECIQEILEKEEVIDLNKLYVTLDFIELLAKYSKKIESEEFIFNVKVSTSRKPLTALREVKCSKFDYA